MLQYNGDWTSGTAPGIPNASVTHPFQETSAQGASVTMDIGLGAVGVSVHTFVDWGNWLVEVVSELYTCRNSCQYLQSMDGAAGKTYNASTFWKVPDAVLFFEGVSFR